MGSDRTEYVMGADYLDLEARVRAMAMELPPSDLASTRSIQHITHFVRELLSAAPSVTGEREPVAWRWRFKADPATQPWVVINYPLRNITPNLIVQPLYDSPSPSHVKDGTELDPEAIADAVIERVVNLDEYTSPDDCPDLLMARQNTLHFIVADVVRASQEKGEA